MTEKNAGGKARLERNVQSKFIIMIHVRIKPKKKPLGGGRAERGKRQSRFWNENPP